MAREGFLKDKYGPRAKKFERHWFIVSVSRRAEHGAELPDAIKQTKDHACWQILARPQCRRTFISHGLMKIGVVNEKHWVAILFWFKQIKSTHNAGFETIRSWLNSIIRWSVTQVFSNTVYARTTMLAMRFPMSKLVDAVSVLCFTTKKQHTRQYDSAVFLRTFSIKTQMVSLLK